MGQSNGKGTKMFIEKETIDRVSQLAERKDDIGDLAVVIWHLLQMHQPVGPYPRPEHPDFGKAGP